MRWWTALLADNQSRERQLKETYPLLSHILNLHSSELHPESRGSVRLIVRALRQRGELQQS